MKRILLAAFIGTGMLLVPVEKTSAAIYMMHRIIDISLEGYDLLIESTVDTGTIDRVNVVNSSGATVRRQSCGGYTCEVSLAGLPSGTYTIKVYTTLSYYEDVVSI